jgi:hypothetical protein
MRSILVTVLLALSLPLFAADPPPTISVTAPDVEELDANGNLVFHVAVANIATVDVADVTAQFSFNGLFALVSARGADCAKASDLTFQCTLPSIAVGKTDDFEVAFKPPVTHGRLAPSISVTAHVPYVSTVFVSPNASIYEPFVVTTTADDGLGSLRQAIVAANRTCGPVVPCRISFAIDEPVPPRGWYTIEPQSSFAPVDVGEIVIDGRYHNATPVEIRGTHALGDGLVLRGSVITVSGLSIDGFFDNGVVIDQKNPSTFRIAGNVIGSDPGGAPVPNGLRGVAVVRGSGAIEDNTIAGNARSGIFVTTDLPLRIAANRITGNGASGIYVGPSNPRLDIAKSVISGNHDFAIAIDPRAVLVAVRDNSMFDNGAPVDIGMDGPGAASAPSSNVIEPAPRIATAIYDAAIGDTVVTIDVNPLAVHFDTFTLYVYANRTLDRAGRAEAEMFLGTVPAEAKTIVTFRVHADLRGQYVTAMTLRSSEYTEFRDEVSSELSDGVVVR